MWHFTSYHVDDLIHGDTGGEPCGKRLIPVNTPRDSCPVNASALDVFPTSYNIPSYSLALDMSTLMCFITEHPPTEIKKEKAVYG